MFEASRDPGESRADVLCSILNLAFELKSEPEVSRGAYTGRVILTEDAALALAADRQRRAKLVPGHEYADQLRHAGAARFVRRAWSV